MSGFYPLYVTAALTSQIQEVGMLRLELWDVGNGGFGSIKMDDGAIVALDSDGNVISFGGGSGDMILATAQTVTAAKTFNNATLLLRNVANTFSAQFTNTNTAARTYTLPDAAGTIALTSNITGTNSGTNTGDQTITLTGMVTGSGTGSFVASLGTFTKAQLDTAISDGNVLYVGDAPTAHNHSATEITSGTLPVARGGTGLTALGTSLQVLRTNAGATALEYATITSGIGGSTGATDNRILAADGTGGATVQSRAVTIDDSGNLIGGGYIGAVNGSFLGLSNSNYLNGTTYFRDVSETLYGTFSGVLGAFSLVGGAGNMSITSGTGNSRTMALKTTNASGTAITALTLDASQNASFASSVTIGGGTAIAKVLSATATLDFPSIASNDTQTLTMTVTGAVAGNSVFVGVPSALDANLIWCASVTAADTVTIRMHNSSGASIDPASGTYRASVFQF